MTTQIQDLVRFYSHKHHVPILLLTDSWQIECWDKQGIAVVLPSDAANARAILKLMPGDLIVMDSTPVARISKQWFVLCMWANDPSVSVAVRKLIDQHLPRLCPVYRHKLKDALVESITACVQDRKRELQSSIREDSYELERLSLQQMQLSRKLETDRQVLRLFEKAPEWIKARSMRTFVDLFKLVPAVYSSFKIEDESVVGMTHSIEIEHDGYTYHFDPYSVEVNLRQGKVFITGGTNMNGYIHPHCTDEASNVCWGNVGHLVSRLAGELDLFGLFQLVHTFLTTYNSSDPYQRIEKWNLGWEEEEDSDEPYCSWCDDYGHDICDCDGCCWCSHCNEYADHDEETCPNCPKEESEEDHELVEESTA